MTWLLPSVLAIAGVGAVATIALHFIARSRPLAEPLPTARFVPQQPVYARSRSIALSDFVLLALRLAAIAAIGAGVAGPVLSARGTVARIVVADRSRAVANVADVRDSARAYLRAGDQFLVFDSIVRASPALDSLTSSDERGSLSAALAAATRAAVRAAPHADSMEIVLVSPLSEEEVDAATFKIRDAWPGRIRVVPVMAARSVPLASRVETSVASSDAVAAGLSLMGVASLSGTVRLVRARPSPADSAWARLDGHVLLVWPENAAISGWTPRSVIDTIGGVATTNGATLIATLARAWSLDGRAIARWADGTPAAVEHAAGAGCIRDVGILIDQSSDLTLRPSFRTFVRDLLLPCGGARATNAIGAPMIAALAGTIGRAAPAASLRDRAEQVSRATPWLLVVGAVLLILELAARRATRRLA